MYVCLCRGVSDRKVRSAISRGATTIEEIGDRCAAGTRCGGCWPVLEDLLRAAGHDPQQVYAGAGTGTGRPASHSAA
jgi:bacterioferritin-associated ferredoxin